MHERMLARIAELPHVYRMSLVVSECGSAGSAQADARPTPSTPYRCSSTLLVAYQALLLLSTYGDSAVRIQFP